MVAFVVMALAFVQGGASQPDSLSQPSALGQITSVNDYISVKLADVALKGNEPQHYDVTTYFTNRDIYGNPTSKALITAEYTRALGDGLVRWDDVRIATWQDLTGSFSDGQVIDCMNGLTYKSPEDIASPELYKGFPKDDSQHLLRMLIWDAIGIEVYGWMFFDNLKINETYYATDFEDYAVQMADWGLLTLKDLRLKWAGITSVNDENCALVEYQSFCNPTESTSPAMTVKGRSLYWGSICISLEDKQIEFGTLNEDVIMETTGFGGSEERIMNMQREVIFEKKL
jgi:hypothetical protein